MDYTVKEVVALPVFEEREVYTDVTAKVPTGESVRKEPGDTVTTEELEEHGQNEEAVAHLVEIGAIEEAS